MSENIEIQVLENPNENWNLLIDAWIDFHTHCPTLTSVRGLLSAEARGVLEHSLCEMVQSADCPVLIAWDKVGKQVAGICLHSMESRFDDHRVAIVDRPGTWKLTRFTWPGHTDKDIKDEDEFWCEVEDELDFFNKFSFDRVWHIECLGVRTDYARCGLGKILIQRSAELAREQEHDVVKANFASEYSRKIGIACGFETVLVGEYKGRLKTYPYMPEEIRDVHTGFSIMVKRLYKAFIARLLYNDYRQSADRSFHDLHY